MKEAWEQDESDKLKTGEPIHDGLIETLLKMKEDMGAEAYNAFAISLAEQEEAGLRERNPSHPLLQLLDAHRARRANGFF